MPVQAGTCLDPRVRRRALHGRRASSATGPTPTGTTDVSESPAGRRHRVLQHRLGRLRLLRTAGAPPGTWSCPATRPSRLGRRERAQQHTPRRDVIDRLELPGGGHFVDLADATGGWDRKVGLPPLECRSLETFSAASGVTLSAPDATLIRYAAGMPAALMPKRRRGTAPARHRCHGLGPGHADPERW